MNCAIRCRFIQVSSFALLACLVAAGCGPTLHSVEGEITVDEKPLAKGNVVLWPDSAKGNSFTGQPTGEVENGKFRVMTQGKVGAPAGWYNVTVSSSEKIDSTKVDAIKEPIGPSFREASKTPLKIEVPSADGYKLKANSKQ